MNANGKDGLRIPDDTPHESSGEDVICLIRLTGLIYCIPQPGFSL